MKDNLFFTFSSLIDFLNLFFSVSFPDLLFSPSGVTEFYLGK